MTDAFDSQGRRSRIHPTSTGKRVTPQARDMLWFKMIHRHGPLSSSFLHAFSQHIRKSEKRAKDRLTDLFNESNTPHGGAYLMRPPQQFRTLDSRYNDLIYDLTPASKAALMEQNLWEETAAPHAGPWLHRYMVSSITASIELATLSRDDISYIPQTAILERAKTQLRHLTTIIDPKSGKREKKDLIPDALFGLEYLRQGERSYRFFLVEADRGAEPATSSHFNRKSHLRGLLQYRDYIGNGTYKKHLKLTANMMVLNVMTDLERQKKLIALIERLSEGAGNTYMLYRTWDAFGALWKPPKPISELLEGSWQRAGRKEFRIDMV